MPTDGTDLGVAAQIEAVDHVHDGRFVDFHDRATSDVRWRYWWSKT
jgi:hypothetical protein